MRLTVQLLAAFSLLAAATAAPAAPTCQTALGQTIKCGTDGAMPVGWAPDQLPAIQAAAPSMTEIWGPLALCFLLLTLIALMPKFDGSRGADWDPQEGDERR